jgi:hypothetical protein
MKDKPILQSVNERLDRMDQSWQELVKLLNEGQVEPSTQRIEPETLAPEEAVGDAPESGLSSANLGKRDHEVSSSVSEAPLRGQKFFHVSLIVALVVALGGLTFLMAQTQLGRGKVETGMLTIRGKDGLPRAWLGERDGQVSLSLLDKAGRSRVKLSLDASGNPGLYLFDKHGQNVVELVIGPEGEPILRQIQKSASPAMHAGQEPAPPENKTAAPPATALPKPDGPQTPAAVSTLPENLDRPKAVGEPMSPPAEPGPGTVSASPDDAGSKASVSIPTVKYVGSITSNKYHYPDCKWAKAIQPEKLIGFSSVKEAREKGYIPCPVCRPPVEDKPDLGEVR